jgi:hypothetical protein
MADDTPRWTLEDLVAFEQAVTASTATSPVVRAAVVAVSRGLAGASARRAGLRVWLEETGRKSAGRKFTSALAMVGGGLSLVIFLLGISAVFGMLDRQRGGINVTVFLAILVGGQWLVLLLAGVAWSMRWRAAEGFSGVQALAGKLARWLAGNADDAWWQRLMDGGGAPRAAVLWRLARMAQKAGIFFNLGILCGIGGLVLVRHIGFFWETTTEGAMAVLLEKLSQILSLPWSAWWPAAVPGPADLEAARWQPGRELPRGPSVWWEFLMMVTFFWGLLPRSALWVLAWAAERRALTRLDFQSRCHRALWREITSIDRVETEAPPLDGVLVLDVGGNGLTEEVLRPFLLRRLRVHPATWQSTAVLDPGAEADAARALEKAPAGVVLVAEGWSLSPARMISLHGKIRTCAGPEAPLKFLIANVNAEHAPAAVTADERREWSRFVDSLRDPATEVFFYEDA